MALGSCSVAELADVFQEHLLCHLSVSSLAQLRAASQALRTLVDTGDSKHTNPRGYKSRMLHNLSCQAEGWQCITVHWLVPSTVKQVLATMLTAHSHDTARLLHVES